jgi:hypothetical protein
MKLLLTLLLAILLIGCDEVPSPFDFNTVPVGQVEIILSNGLPICPGDTLTAEIPDFNNIQKEGLDIVYEWYRISKDTAPEKITDQSENGENTYTIKFSDFENSIKVKALFKYGKKESETEATRDIAKYDEKFILTGDILIKDTWVISRSLIVNGKITVSRGEVTVGNLIVPSRKELRIGAGGSIIIEDKSLLDLQGTLDLPASTGMTVKGTLNLEPGADMTVNRTVICKSGSTVTRLPNDFKGNGKFIFSEGCIVNGLIGPEYKIDNYSNNNTIEYSKNNGNEIFTLTGDIKIIDTWTISGSLVVNGNVTIESTKDIRGSLASSSIKVGAGASVTGGINSLNLTTGTYNWVGNNWRREQ